MTHPYPDTRLFIAGQWCDAADGRTLPVHNPASGTAIGRVAHASTRDLDRALEAADRGFKAWRSTLPVERNKIMRRAAQLVRERVDQTASLLTCEQGKPLGEARAELLTAADIIDWFADEGMRIQGRVLPVRSADASQAVLRFPVGPVAAFSPWNFPVTQAVRKLSAALATGCSILIKAPEETPASPAELVRAFADAGVPEGTLGLVFGEPKVIAEHLITHPIIRKVTFTGSTAVGRQLAALAGLHMKRVTMELGGHAPVIVAHDADVEKVIRIAGAAKFRNAGQVCVSPTRFLAHRSVYPRLVEELAAYARRIRVGDGTAQETQMGPVANPRRVSAMARLTQDAIARGAAVLAGGNAIEGPGNFWTPTVLADVPLDAQVFNEEPFGPIAAIRSFDSLDEAITEANRLPYGLAAYAYTDSHTSAHRLAQELEVGMLWINQAAAAWPELPFGGIKDSGYGAEGGPEALEAYLTTRTVATTHA